MTFLLEGSTTIAVLGALATAGCLLAIFVTQRLFWLAIAGGVFVLTAILFAVGHFVVTDREALEILFNELAEAVVKEDVRRVEQSIDPSKQPLLLRARNVISQYRFSEIRVTDVAPTIDAQSIPKSAKVRLTCFVTLSGADPTSGRNTFPVRLWVYLHKQDKNWLIDHYEEN